MSDDDLIGQYRQLHSTIEKFMKELENIVFEREPVRVFAKDLPEDVLVAIGKARTELREVQALLQARVGRMVLKEEP